MISSKSYHSIGSKKKLLWRLIRPLIPYNDRFFFEGHPKIMGQLHYAERKLIYETVIKYKPNQCFEIGTWKGGGSTLFIAQALYQNKRGILNTVEINKNFYNEAKASYEKYLKHLLPYVAFHLGDYNRIYYSILNSIAGLDFLFLDGPEDAIETLNQYNFFSPYFREGTILIMHDWYTDKSRLVKEKILEEESWELKEILSPPKSIGIGLALKK